MTAAVNQPTDADVLLSVADMLRDEMREHAVWCGTCGRKHLRSDTPGPWVDVAPDTIPTGNPAAHDRVMDLIARAVTVASHLRALGTPAHAIHLGGY